MLCTLSFLITNLASREHRKRLPVDTARSHYTNVCQLVVCTVQVRVSLARLVNGIFLFHELGRLACPIARAMRLVALKLGNRVAVVLVKHSKVAGRPQL
jgi:hypothetical protein